MECSCGSSSFQNSSVKHEVESRACMYSFSACKSCGRQADHQLSDELTGEVLAKGVAAVRVVQGREMLRNSTAEPCGIDQEQAFDAASDVAPSVANQLSRADIFNALGALSDQGLSMPSEKPLTVQEMGKPLHDRGRHYFLWNGETQKARMKYLHHLYDNGAQEVRIPALGLIDSCKASDERRDVLSRSLRIARNILEQHFNETTKSTAVTCAPPQGDWLEVCKGGEWVSMLERIDPTISTAEPSIEADHVTEIITQDTEAATMITDAEVLEVGTVIDSDSMTDQTDEFDPLAVSPNQQDSKETVQMSLF